MPELIDRQDLIKDMCNNKTDAKCPCYPNCYPCDFSEARRIIDIQPTIEPEVRHGRWILERTPDGTPYCLHCSECDPDFAVMYNKVATDYCPDCGAEMETDMVYERDDYDGTKKEDET